MGMFRYGASVTTLIMLLSVCRHLLISFLIEMVFSSFCCIESEILSSFQKYKFYVNPLIAIFVQITTHGPTVLVPL